MSNFKSEFSPPNIGEYTLRSGQILAENEMPFEMVERVVKNIESIELKFDHTKEDIDEFIRNLGQMIDSQKIVFSTPILTNAGRYLERPLSACVVPPVDLRGDLSKVREIVNEYHQDGMGTGFDLSNLENPTEMLRFLNSVAVDGAISGKEQRPVGNMATLNISHPKILDFINVKKNADSKGEIWKFNISVNITDEFMNCVIDNLIYTLENGESIDARSLFYQLAEAAYYCGDPGIVFLDRMNADNPTPFTGNYTSTAPCAEVGLAPGESCQFGYINLGRIINTQNGNSQIDFVELERVTAVLLRALDDALEVSISNYSTQESSTIMSQKRKVGIGICGYADLLIKLGIAYDSPEAREILLDIVNFINYHSKVASVALARIRGSALALKSIGSKYAQSYGYLEQRYGELDTPHVKSTDWIELSKNIYENGFLRNVTTIALPPTGRSGLTVGASTGIEPLFSLADNFGINPLVLNYLSQLGLDELETLGEIYESGKLNHLEKLPVHIKEIFKTATDISASNHILTVAAVQQAVDESISKTINLPEQISIEEIVQIQISAYQLGLKGISIFRNNSRFYQPKEL